MAKHLYLCQVRYTCLHKRSAMMAKPLSLYQISFNLQLPLETQCSGGQTAVAIRLILPVSCQSGFACLL
jgi:hypothetical protein